MQSQKIANNTKIIKHTHPGCNTTENTVFYLQIGPAAAGRGNQGEFFFLPFFPDRVTLAAAADIEL